MSRPRPSSGQQYERVAGCLLGGALGDALGAPVEFLSLSEIRGRYGPAGIVGLDEAYGRRGAITDDTQMTLFTAEGLLRAHNRWREKGICHLPTVVWHAYLRWLHTQGEASAAHAADDGWLIGVEALHARRGPGRTCLSALRKPQPGTIEERINHSKGCGAVMRAAPVGLIALDDPFATGAEIGALTHGHPSGYLSAAFLSLLVSRVLAGAALLEAVSEALARVERPPDSEEVQRSVERALALAERGDPTPEQLETLGAGWVGEEALAIGLYCALVADDFRDGVILAANHGGDSDSTAAIAGSLLGLAGGASSLPAAWLAELELREEIEAIAADLVRHGGPDPDDLERYPGW